MSIAAALAFITALSNALPVLDKWIESLVVAYSIQRKLWIKKENILAIKKAIETQDQRELEDEEHSGDYSGLGTIRDSLPGVRNSEKN
jgi:hypothetical protein